MSEEKFSKCGEEKKSVEFRVFGKKGNWKKSSGKKIKVFFFGWKFKVKDFAKLCSLVGLHVNLQVKVTGKMMKIFQSIFRVGF